MAKKAKYESHYLNDIFIDGVLRFPKLNEPDTYNPEKPCYKTDIIPTAADLAALKKKLVAFGHEHFPDADLYLPIKKDKKDDSIVFVTASTRRKDKETGELKRPLIVDAKRKPLSRSVEIGGGTIAKLKVTATEYEGTKLTDDRPGVALLLEVVQVKKLVKFNDALAGFGDEEGYSQEDEGDIEGDTSTTETTGGDAYDL